MKKKVNHFYTAEQQMEGTIKGVNETFLEKVRMRDKKVQSVQEINFDNLVLPMIAVHKNPDDYPDHCVARVFNLEIPTHVVMVKESLQEIMEDIKEHTDMTFFDRRVDSVPSLVGVWV